MIRKIIEIDTEKCNGCGACVDACHEGAIKLIDGKARLIRDDYCDGLGDCLPACPTDAITFTEREAAAYDEEAVMRNKYTSVQDADNMAVQDCGCPGSRPAIIESECSEAALDTTELPSRLSQWPVQIQLVPVRAPYYQDADLLIAADCTAYAYAGFHDKFIRGRITLIGCPKLDYTDYSEKLTEIIRGNEIKSVTLVRMEVPCCGGLQHAAATALQNSGRDIPFDVITISNNGKIL